MPSPLRTVIFIDGQNFRNNLRNFSFRSSNARYPPYELEEKHFLWKPFFQNIINEFYQITGRQHELIRSYWYYAGSISSWRENSRFALQIVNDYAGTVQLTVAQVNELAKKWYDGERRYFERLREVVFENIQHDTDFLEFKYVGQYVVRPYRVHKIDTDQNGNVINYLGLQQGEKGVDVGIAVDMIAKMANYDVAILVSGDSDFLPVVRYLKDNLKYVYQFSLAKGVPPRIEYLSRYLIGVADCFAYFDESRLLSDFLDRQNANIPYPILQAIDARIASLTQTP